MHQFVVETPNAASKVKTRSHLAVNIIANVASCNMVIDHVRKFVVDKHLEVLTVLNRKTGVINMYSQVTLN